MNTIGNFKLSHLDIELLVCYFSYVVGATRNSDFESSSHLVIIVFCFELSHLVTEVLKCFIVPLGY